MKNRHRTILIIITIIVVVILGTYFVDSASILRVLHGG